MTFAFVAKHRHISPVSWMCDVLGVARSGFHASLRRPINARASYDLKLVVEIDKSVKASDRSYGAHRVWRDVVENGLACGLHRIARPERQNAIRGRPKRRGKPKLKTIINPSNAPDAFTEAAIEESLARQEAGAEAADLATTDIVEEGGDKVFRMVKAIPTGALCLSCHGGAEVAPDVEAALARLYPQDEARGFREGDMRGVFRLRKNLE